jgi:hypothetical protein
VAAPGEVAKAYRPFSDRWRLRESTSSTNSSTSQSAMSVYFLAQRASQHERTLMRIMKRRTTASTHRLRATVHVATLAFIAVTPGSSGERMRIDRLDS